MRSTAGKALAELADEVSRMTAEEAKSLIRLPPKRYKTHLKGRLRDATNALHQETKASVAA